MSFSVDGLASGLDTTAIINQLLAVERQPMVRLQARQQLFRDRVKAWGDIGTAITNLNTAVKDLRTASAFNAFRAVSSNENVVTASASSSAATGAFSFTVESLAAAHQQISQGFSSSSALVGAGVATVSTGLSAIDVTSVDASTGGLPTGTYSIEVLSVDSGAGTASVKFNGVTQTVASTGTVTLTGTAGSIDLNIGTELTVGTAKASVINTTASTTLSELRTSINNVAGGASATVVNTGTGSTPYKLIVTSKQTGLDNALTIDTSGLSGFTSSFTDLRAAADASLTLGGGAETISRSSNTITDLIDGVTFNLVAADPGNEVTVEIKQDTDAVVGKVQKLVDALNSLVSVVNKHSKFDVDTQKGGVLVGDSRARDILSKISTALGYVDTSLTTATGTSVGISSTAQGTYTLDSTKLKTALESNPDDVFKLFTEDTTLGRTGLAGSLYATTDPMRTPGGLIDLAKQGSQGQVDELQKRIDSFEDRLSLISTRIRRQFTSLETTLSQLNSQSAFLRSQLAGL